MTETPKSVVISDESINSYGFYLLNKGADLSLYKKNPIMLWMHNRAWRGKKEEVLPIGTLDNLRFNEDKQRWEGDPVFDMEDKFAAEIGRKWEAGILRMVSAGVRPVEWSEDKKLMKKGQTRPTLTKWILREVSIVDIGSNYNSLAFYDEKGECVNLSDIPEDEFPVKKLFDNQNNKQMEVIKLSDNTELNADQVQKLYDDSKTHAAALKKLDDSNKELSDKVEGFEKAEKEAEKAEATQLMDAAVKDGRIDATPDKEGNTARDNWQQLFDKDHKSAKLALESLPKRTPASEKLSDEDNPTEREELEKLSWDELDKAEKLETLKDKYYDLYEQKYEKEFGSKPKKS